MTRALEVRIGYLRLDGVLLALAVAVIAPRRDHGGVGIYVNCRSRLRRALVLRAPTRWGFADGAVCRRRRVIVADPVVVSYWSGARYRGARDVGVGRPSWAWATQSTVPHGGSR